MSFGNWIREQRAEKRLTASECAERAGVTKPVWSRWENDDDKRNGEYQPRRQTVMAVAKALGVSSTEALIAAGYKPANDSSSEDAVIAEIEQRVPAEKRNMFRRSLRRQAEQIAELLCA